jgi:hypothetical protein
VAGTRQITRITDWHYESGVQFLRLALAGDWDALVAAIRH